MKRASLIILLVLAVLGQAFCQVAEKVSEERAFQTAKAFTQAGKRFQSAELQLVSASDLFIYNVGSQGFVIISGNTVLPPVLGYSSQGPFPDLTEAPENVTSWIGHYGEMIHFAVENGIAPEKDIQRQWEEAAQGIFGSREAQTVDPLVATRWNQDCFYNEYCPATSGGWWGGGPCGHAYAGCVACAMAQVMKYWNHPAQGYGTHSYVHSEYGQQSADFGSTTYHWEEMPNEIWEHNDAVATLMYHCGVSVNMNYGPSSSGAFSPDVETAMRSYFGYCGAKYRQKSTYSEETWVAMLKAELDLSHPIYYSGNNSEAGHAFVCDGYDSDDLMHFNFGWSGSGDGYYSTYDVIGFDQNQAVVTNLFPLAFQADENGIIYVSPDGEGNGSSWGNATNRLEFATILSRGNGIKVWVKKGTYHGDLTNTEGAFYITEGNRVYGSFNGDETPDYDLSQRDFVENASILDGQGERRVLIQENALTSGTAAVWDGFIIQNGSTGSGAGAYLNNYVTLSNCNIRNNTATMYGGGVYLNSGGSAARTFLTNCSITGNSASMGGGVCDRVGGALTNCNISNNTASTKGGGLYLYINTEPTITNCVFANNTAKSAGGIYNRGKITAYNCNFVKNLGIDELGGVFNEKHYNRYINCIFWGNVAKDQPSQVEGASTFEYCAVQGGVEGTEIIDLPAENNGQEPGVFVRFNHPSEGAGAEFQTTQWSLHPRSICLNAGKPNTTGLGATDIYGNPRIQKGRVEIGAYESCASLTLVEDACYESGTYWFNGRPLTEPGYYTTVLNGHDCDSVIGLTLTMLEGVEGDGPSTGSGASGAFAVWPNPTTGQIHIDAETPCDVEVRNMLGQIVLQTEKVETIEISNLENGIYFLIVKLNGKSYITKVVKR